MINQEEYSVSEKPAGSLPHQAGNTRMQEPDFLKEFRLKAADSYNNLAVPTTRDEQWKYTPVKSILQADFTSISESVNSEINESVLEAYDIKGLDCYHIVLINGQYSKQHSQVLSEADAAGMQILPFQEAVHTASFKEYFNKRPADATDYFSALNLSKVEGGIFIEVARGYKVSKPVYVLNLLGASGNTMLNTRNLVIVHELAQIELIECSAGRNAESKLVLNHSGEVFLARQAHASQVFIQRGNKGTSFFNKNECFLSADSNFSNYTFTLQGAFTRNNLNLYLEQAGIEAHMYGFYQTSDNELVDNHTLADHQVNNCMSSEHYKGILNGKSSGVFNGKVVVHPDAQKTNAYQQNNSILLGKESSMNSKPELVIFADDVKCSHGSTIGQLNADSLFYLKARGISEETAKLLLIKAFAHELTLRLKPDALRDHLNELIG